MAGDENICFRARKRNFSETGRFEDDPRLSGEAAEAAGLPWDSEYDDADLQIDVSLEDGETIELGDHTIYAFATIGHTKCSMSYLIDDELMLCSETVGVMGHDGSYMPSFLVDYKAAEESIEYSSELDAKEIILNHYGLVSERIRRRSGMS